MPFKTVDGLAKNGKDYIANEGFVNFVDEETRYIWYTTNIKLYQFRGTISITIINDDEYEKAGGVLCATRRSDLENAMIRAVRPEAGSSGAHIDFTMQSCYYGKQRVSRKSGINSSEMQTSCV